MTERKEACCTSPSAICYWFAASLIASGVLSFIAIYWHPLHALSPATILLAMAIGCIANWFRNRTFHCAVTGPLFLIAALLFLPSGVVHANTVRVWPAVLVGVAIAFLLEWRYTRLSASYRLNTPNSELR
jgi:hypothetical protein